MRKLKSLCIIMTLFFIPLQAFAVLSLELTRGVSGAIPIAIVPFASSQGEMVAAVVGADLKNSGRFKVFDKDVITQNPSKPSAVSNEYFKNIGANYVVVGTVEPLGSLAYQVSFQLMDTLQPQGEHQVQLNKQFTVNSSQLRGVAHRISDLIYEHLTGTRGIFSTKLAYVMVQRFPNGVGRYTLEVADQDGFNPRTVLTSSEPIMSPSWSPSGRELAYVSFENRRAGIYIQDVTNGSRRLLSQFAGINGAPAWSHDGRKLALVLSKSGSPNIYIMEIATGHLTQLTHDFYINTEPTFSPDGKSILYTSNRAGGPQIYQLNLASGAVSRVSYDGDYNARASFTQDGKSIAMIHRVSGIYHIALLNLDTGATRVLSSQAGDSASPSVAPNGSMILYDTLSSGRNTLAMVSSDGGVQLALPARQGEAQDPAWSPYQS